MPSKDINDYIDQHLLDSTKLIDYDTSTVNKTIETASTKSISGQLAPISIPVFSHDHKLIFILTFLPTSIAQYNEMMSKGTQLLLKLLMSYIAQKIDVMLMYKPFPNLCKFCVRSSGNLNKNYFSLTNSISVAVFTQILKERTQDKFIQKVSQKLAKVFGFNH